MDFSKPRQADLISLSILLGIRKISSIVKKFKKSELDGHDGLGNGYKAPLLAQDVKLSYLMIRMMMMRRSTMMMRTTMMMISTTTRSGVGITKL